MAKELVRVETTPHQYIFIDASTGIEMVGIKRTGKHYNADSEEMKMIQKIKRACLAYLLELGYRKGN